MAYDEALAGRIQDILTGEPGVVSKKMFGGVGYLLRGNMACGVHKDMLMVRVGPQAYDTAIQSPHTRPFDMTGRPMKGWILVEPAGFSSKTDLKQWVQIGVNFALTLPPK